MEIAEFQKKIEATFYEKDRARGTTGTFVWFVEEVGELARAIQRNDRKNLHEEFADCLAWLFTLASLEGIDMSQAIRKYENGCPRCHEIPCGCSTK